MFFYYMGFRFGIRQEWELFQGGFDIVLFDLGEFFLMKGYGVLIWDGVKFEEGDLLVLLMVQWGVGEFQNWGCRQILNLDFKKYVYLILGVRQFFIRFFY